MIPPSPPAPPRPDIDQAGPPSVDPHDVPWRWWHAIGVYLLGFVALGSILALPVLAALGDPAGEGGGTGLGLPGLVAALVVDVAFIGVMIVFLRWRSSEPAAAVGLPPWDQRLRDLAGGLGLGLLLYAVVALGVGTILVIVFRLATGELVRPAEQLSPDLSAWARVVAVVFALIAAPIGEELFFRGILFRSLRRHGFWVAAVVSSILFGLVHYAPGLWKPALFLAVANTFTGFGLAWIYERRGLAASMGAHLGFNTVGIIAVLVFG